MLSRVAFLFCLLNVFVIQAGPGNRVFSQEVPGISRDVSEKQTPLLEELRDRLDVQEAELATLRQALEQHRSTELGPITQASSESESATDVLGNDDGVGLVDILAGRNKRIDGTVKPGTSGSSMKVTGRVHIDYWGFPQSDPGINQIESGDVNTTPQDRLGFRRIRFGVRGNVNPNMEYRIEMEFASGNDAEFRDVWLGFHDMGILQTVLIGNQKRPYGLDHLNSSRYNVFIERPFVIESFNQNDPTAYEELGAIVDRVTPEADD